MAPLGIFLLSLAALVAFMLFIIFVLVPVFRGIGWLLANFFTGISWVVAHLFEFIGGLLSDVMRFVGAILVMVVLTPFVPLNVIIGRWSAAGHFTDSVKREFLIAAACLYRVVIRRPLKLFWLHGLLEGLEQRVPEAMQAAPTSDKPSKRVGQYDGYTIVGSLRAGGSGGKLYVARPDDSKRSRLLGKPELVVIKSFALTEGSSLPQIVRESRALECAKQLGHVLDHGMDDHRFFYVMPYHPGEHLGIITRQLHAQTDGRGLSQPQLGEVMHYIKDLLATLTLYHKGGLWHKDIKPENIIVHDGRAHVVDLGLVTPLKSAMTLTTHGTEYFRDPEMVRQALRGVKVHQVNGAKFDIYAAGAVLYFMIENTFPAHGGLSRFTHNSPEALRWIVRRAMAEYHQRYGSAEMMLADLEAVANSRDPFTIKPADLPSMRGSSEDLDLDLETESPQGVKSPHAPASSTSPRRTPGARPASWGDVATQGPGQRPAIRVTNWWTGEYVVDHGPDARESQDDRPHRLHPDQPSGTFRGAVAAGRLTAREQIHAARSRARSMQQRAAQRRHSVGIERQPSAGVIVASLIVLGLIVGAALTLLPAGMGWINSSSAHRKAEAARAEALARAETVEAVVRQSNGRPVLVVVDAPDPDAIRDDTRFERLLKRYQARNYHLVTTSSTIEDRLRDLVLAWQNDPKGSPNDAMEEALADLGAYGVLYVKQRKGANSSTRFTETLIHSTREDAATRRWPTVHVNFDPPEEPYLLVNDHPARLDERVRFEIDRMLSAYRSSGFTIESDVDAEAKARRVLPVGTPLSSETPTSPRLSQLLRELDYAGVVYVYAPPGEGEPHERIGVEIISPSPLIEIPDVPSTPAPPAPVQASTINH